MSGETIATAVGTGFAVFSWLLWISYCLGRNSQKLDDLSKSFREFAEKANEKLDLLPHQCLQVEAISAMKIQIATNTKKLNDLDERVRQHHEHHPT